MRLLIIGLGGIGTHLLPTLLQYLNYEDQKELFSEIVLLDGDSYEESNRSRQNFDSLGNKAEVTAAYYNEMYGLPIIYDTEYITSANIKTYIKDGDVVLSCVDNNATRLLLEKHLLTLKNCTVVSGGNDLTDGNITITQMVEGKLTTPLLTELHPEISTPKDKNPADLSCEALAALPSGGQIGLVNSAVANVMRTVLFSLINKRLEFSEVFVDCLTAATRAIKLDGNDEMNPTMLGLGEE